MFFYRTVLLVVAFVATFSSVANGQIPVIELAAVFPCGGKAGSEIDLSVTSGTRNEEVDALMFSHPGITATVVTKDPLPFSDERQKQHGQFKVKVADNVAPGLYEVRAIGRHGVSNPRRFLVHHLDETRLTPSHSRLAPTKIAIDTVFHAKATATDIDCYQIDMVAGQTIKIDLHAASIDSRMIAEMALHDSKGKVVQTAGGSDELDPNLTFRSDTAQSFLLVVSDAIFRGGNDYGYIVVVRSAENDSSLVHEKFTQQKFVRSVGDYSELVATATEIEERSDAKTLTAPCKITSLFDTRDDVDQYEFTASEGDTYTIDLVSHRLGQPTDARIFIERAEPQKGKEPKWSHVAVDDDSYNISDAVLRLNTNDPVLAFKAPKSATYRLTVRDLDTGTTLRKNQRYWIDIRKPTPAVDLIVYQDYPHRDTNQSHQRGSNLCRGGVDTLRVFAIRRDGWAGPIELSIQGMPEGVSSPVVTMAADRNEVQMTLAANDNAPANIANLKVVGTVTISGKQTTIQSQFATIQWGRGGQRQFHRLRRSDDLVVAVSDRDIAPIAFSIGDGSAIELKKGGEAKLPIQLKRQDTAKNECIVRPRDLPPNVQAGEVKIAKDKSDGQLVFKANGNAVPGTYSLWLQTETKIKHKPNPQSLERAKAYRNKLQKLHDDPANKDKLEAIKAAIKTADARVESAKGNAKDQDLTVFLPSPSITIRIVE